MGFMDSFAAFNKRNMKQLHKREDDAKKLKAYQKKDKDNAIAKREKERKKVDDAKQKTPLN